MAKISVLMPTYGQAWHLNVTYASLLKQEFTDWELIVVIDGDRDGSTDIVEAWQDPRVRVHKNLRNRGLGACLNIAQDMATADVIAYLPSDDVFHQNHLALLLETLEDPAVFLAYSGVQRHLCTRGWRGLTLAGNNLLDWNGKSLSAHARDAEAPTLPSGNVLALVQVAHRRVPGLMKWVTRDEHVSDRLEMDMWEQLWAKGKKFASTQEVTCEWTDHPDQRHKIISMASDSSPVAQSGTAGRGLSGYREYYHIAEDEILDWRPSEGLRVNQLVVGHNELPRSAVEAPYPLKILIAGSLGFNPERMQDLASRGHQLYGAWHSWPQEWDYASAWPGSGLKTLPSHTDEQLSAAIADVQPDVNYGLLNYHALPTLLRVTRAAPSIPFIFHFKESPFLAIQNGLFEVLREVMARAAGIILINEENADWFGEHVPKWDSGKEVMLLDGDLPSRQSMARLPAQLSDSDGLIHTVCSGRPIGLDLLPEIFEQGIHVHLYGEWFHRKSGSLIDRFLDSGLLHLHPAVSSSGWSYELGKYDAAWTHVLPQALMRLRSSAPLWAEMNYPARLGTYAMAGLPWIVQNGPHMKTAVARKAESLGVDISFDKTAELVDRLRDRQGVLAARKKMLVAREAFTFGGNCQALEKFFQRCLGVQNAIQG